MPEHLSNSGVPIPSTDPELLRECRIDVFRAGGKGGQHQNATESGVRLTHLPTGIVTSSRRFRSQHTNKRTALLDLREKLAALNTRDKPRVPTQPTRGAREKRLSSKRRHASKKTLREKPRVDDD
jgi:ribosome-associated protein